MSTVDCKPSYSNTVECGVRVEKTRNFYINLTELYLSPIMLHKIAPCVLVFGVITQCSVAKFTDTKLANFLAKDDLYDSEHEVRVRLKNIYAKQTSVGPAESSESGLVVRQVSNRKQLVQSIYTGLPSDDAPLLELERSPEDGFPLFKDSGLVLRDCNIVTAEEDVTEFLDEFLKDVEEVQDSALRGWITTLFNATFTPVRTEDDLPKSLWSLVRFRSLKSQCKTHHRRVRKALKALRRKELPLEGMNSAGSSEGDSGGATHEEANGGAPLGHSRVRRSVLHSLRIPHTKWCGVGNSANRYSDLGGHSFPDACCREHDACPHYISSFHAKYGLMNWGIGTLSHCACDMRFRSCLKRAETGASNMVGKIFFNMIKTSCFVFKKTKVCRRYSRRGNCERYGLERRAVLREPVPWNR